MIENNTTLQIDFEGSVGLEGVKAVAEALGGTLTMTHKLMSARTEPVNITTLKVTTPVYFVSFYDPDPPGEMETLEELIARIKAYRLQNMTAESA